MAVPDNFNLASVTPVISKMIRCAKNIFVSLAVVLTSVSLSAQVVSSLGSLPLYFEAGPVSSDGTAQFLARSRDGQVLVSSAGAQISLGRDATVLGRVGVGEPGNVTLRTVLGGTRVVDMLVGDQYPRIC